MANQNFGTFGRGGLIADQASFDVGLRQHMIRVYNYMASGLALSGIEPLTLVNISIIFGMVVMPFTYYPILKIAGDRRVLGRHANGRTYQAVGWAFFGVIVIAAAAAIPLALLTNGGKP